MKPSQSQPDTKRAKAAKNANSAFAANSKHAPKVDGKAQKKKERIRAGLGATVDQSLPFGDGGKHIKLPLGRGYKVYLEMRQLKMVLLAMVLYLFAAVVASEWMYLLSSAFGVAVLLGFITPFLELAILEAGYTLPEGLSSQESASIRVQLKRSMLFGPLSWLIPSRALRLTVNMKKRGPDGQPADVMLSPEPVFIEKLEYDQYFSFPTPSLRRGIYFLETIELSTCFPFGIAWWSRSISMKTGKNEYGATITVYPNILNIAGNFMDKLTGVQSPMGHATSSSVITHQSSSFRSVREFRSGDSMRHIHWGSSARQGLMMVREFDSEMLPIFDILLNLRSNYRTEEQFELTVTLVNSLVHLGHNLGHMPRIKLNPPADSPEVQSLLFDLPHMPPNMALIAEILARVEPITKLGANRTSFDLDESDGEDDFKKWDKVNDRPTVTVVPTTDKIAKVVPGKGDIICCPVEVVEIPPNWEDVEEQMALAAASEKDEKGGVSFKNIRGALKKAPKNDLGPVTGKVIARVEWEGDFDTL
ncbi:MAG: DUF58 domain-containing protein [Cyanobacteria bacterium SZAS LIN-2]|nr:DUF58 domain-containing protein [Cyanobacteria bacterium SZAS LIN-2]